MATLREYFDADFNYATRVHVKLASQPDADVGLFYDFSAYTAFLSCLPWPRLSNTPGSSRR